MGSVKTKIFVAGSNGMVGSAIARKLRANPDIELLLATRSELDLLDASAVLRFFEVMKPDQVYLAAARVGGIHANFTYPAEFISQNIQIQSNVVHAAHRSGVQHLLFLGSSCIYPRLASQPISEDALLSGPLEPTNEPYAIAKIAGIKLCESFNRQYGRDYRCVMPTNLYGENDNFHPENSHVIPAMIRRFHEAAHEGAKEVVVWGTGRPMREFLYVDDMASACVHVMGLPRSELLAVIPNSMCSHINVGTGRDVSISQLADLIAKTVGFEGDLIFDTRKPDGTERKVLNVDRLKQLGWTYDVELEQGLAITYQWFLTHLDTLRQ
ncbi:GDP-L-fucose synthase [Luminiphilus sp.]|nr:GDP-L-fucose synthase [Luminiphilus sp.]